MIRECRRVVFMDFCPPWWPTLIEMADALDVPVDWLDAEAGVETMNEAGRFGVRQIREEVP
jgi:hypothetical protein